MNFLKRALTGVCIVAVITGCILYGWASSAVLFALVTIFTTAEFLHIAGSRKGIPADVVIKVAASGCFYASVIALARESALGTCPASVALIALSVLSVMILMADELFSSRPTPLYNIATGLMPVLYIAFPMALIPVLGIMYGRISGTEYDGMLPLMVFVFIWCNDVGAYCVGCTLGKHRLFLRVSPKKSWEGSAGGALLTVAAALCFVLLMPERTGMLPVWMWLLSALTVVVAGTFGDLVESLVKRELGIKDSGNILPGHGGLLDRFDSTLFAVPSVFVLLEVYLHFC